MRNTGLLFYKEYFKSFEVKNNEITFSLEPHNLFNLQLDNSAEVFASTDHFKLTTIYPGLLIGSGYNHEIGKQKDELKLGFFFDYTNGLPCIPGSSIKGVLRDACEKDKGNYIKSIIEDLADGGRKSEVKTEAKKLLADKIDKVFERGKDSDFVMQVFVGKKDKDNYIAQKNHDIFFDAFPVESKNENGKFLANDYITHHANPLKDPNPIQFLKVLPQVTFQFNFRLTDECVTKEIKRELFKQILLDLGVGAKTNVGYGQFTNSINVNGSQKSDDSYSKVPNINIDTLQKQKIPVGVNLKKNEEYEVDFTGLVGDYSFFRFSKEGKKCIIRKKTENVYKKLKQDDYNRELKIGDKLIIKIQEDFCTADASVSFQVLKQITTY